MIEGIVLYYFYLAVHLLFQFWNLVVLRVIWRFTGTQKHLDRIRTGEEKHTRVQLLEIWYTIPVPTTIQPGDCILSHKRFLSIGEVNWRDVVLYRISIAEQSAVFTMFDESVEPFNLRKAPFMAVLQRNRSRRLLRVPLKDFLVQSKICARSIRTRQVVWMLHTFRCGSTAWAQVFAALPEWTVLSEAAPFFTLITEEISDRDVQCFTDSTQFKDLVEATYSMYLYRMGSRKVLIKGGVFDHYLIPAIAERFPKHTILFPYRNSLASACSYYKAFNLIAFEYSNSVLMKKWKSTSLLVALAKRFCWHLYGFSQSALKEEVVPCDMFEWYISTWCIVMKCMATARRNGVQVKGVRYEKLLLNKSEYVQTMFEYLGIDSTYVSLGLKELEMDSQANSSCSKENQQSNHAWQRSETRVRRANEILKHHGLPDLDSDYVFPDTL